MYKYKFLVAAVGFFFLSTVYNCGASNEKGSPLPSADTGHTPVSAEGGGEAPNDTPPEDTAQGIKTKTEPENEAPKEKGSPVDKEASIQAGTDQRSEGEQSADAQSETEEKREIDAQREPTWRSRGDRKPDEWLSKLFKIASEAPSRKDKAALKDVLDNPKKFRFQLVITEFDPSRALNDQLKTHAYRVDHEYLYPASAIKIFGSIAALRSMTLHTEAHPWMDIDDHMSNPKRPQGCHAKDKTNIAGGYVSLHQEIKKTQLVSSNEAFNAVFNFTGFRELHEHIMPDFPSVRVHHRLSSRETHEESLVTPLLHVCDRDTQGEKKSNPQELKRAKFTSKKSISDLEKRLPKGAPRGFESSKKSLKNVGKAYVDMKTREMIKKPMDFTLKNRVSLFDLQRVMMGMVLDGRDTPLGPSVSLLSSPKEGEKAMINPQWLDALRHSMAIYPRHSKNPIYDGKSLSETRFKPLIRGVRRGLDKEERDLYYLNKAGKALGFHLDSAFIATGEGVGNVDKAGRPGGAVKKGVFVTLGLYINDDEIINNDHYEYSKISVPLFNALGYAIGRILRDAKEANAESGAEGSVRTH